MGKIIKKVWNAVTTVLVILLVILAVLLAGARLVGFTPLAVQSGSMEPAYHVGSLIYVKSVDYRELKAGDATITSLFFICLAPLGLECTGNTSIRYDLTEVNHMGKSGGKTPGSPIWPPPAGGGPWLGIIPQTGHQMQPDELQICRRSRFQSLLPGSRKQ